MKKLFLLSAICIAFLGNEEVVAVATSENAGIPGETPDESKNLNMEALNEETPTARDEDFDDDDDDFDDDFEDDFDDEDLDTLDDLEDDFEDEDDDDDIYDEDDDVD